MARLKAFQLTVHAATAWEARTADGRHASQVDLAVLATSRPKAAQAFTGVTRGRPFTASYVARWASETGNAETLAELAKHEPGTVLAGPLDPGGTVLGRDGWIPVPNVRGD